MDSTENKAIRTAFGRLCGEVARLDVTVQEIVKEDSMADAESVLQKYRAWKYTILSFLKFQEMEIETAIKEAKTEDEANALSLALFEATIAYVRSQLKPGQQKIQRMGKVRSIDMNKIHKKTATEKVKQIVGEE